jgi:diphosphomevalonate decarboxylase
MAALAMNFMSLEKIKPVNERAILFKRHLSARLGSGSACRSVKEVLWFGKQNNINGSSDLFGGISKYNTCQFQNYQDTILLVDKGKNKFPAPWVMI